jgi:aminoglycoside 3-N-acetyltransferase I
MQPSEPAPSPVFRLHRLGNADLVLFRRLNALFADVFAEPETYTAHPPDEAYARAVLAKEHVIAVVALAGEDVVGGLVAYELDKLEMMRREVYIYDLAVAQSHRRQGIATALLGYVQGLAARRGAWVVFVQADHADEPAKALYEKLGNREDVLHFDLPVRPSGQ